MTALPPWEPANNGTGKRIWFLIRKNGETTVPIDLRYHTDVKGDLIRYKSMETAQKAADKLNAKEAS